jgi:hypothetical protein
MSFFNAEGSFAAAKGVLATSHSHTTQLIVTFAEAEYPESATVYFLWDFGTNAHEENLSELIQAGYDFGSYHREALIAHVAFIGLCPMDIYEGRDAFRHECLVMEHIQVIHRAPRLPIITSDVRLSPVIRAGGTIDFGPTAQPASRGLLYPSYFLAGHGMSKIEQEQQEMIAPPQNINDYLQKLAGGEWREEAL